MKNLIKIIREHIEYRQQIFKLAKADLVKTYRGAALGWAWAIIKPTVTIFVYWFAFEIGIKKSSAVTNHFGITFPYFLWMIAGVVPWFYISDMLTSGTDTIRRYSYLVTKMKFPVSTIPTFVSISKFIVHLVLIVIMIAIFAFFGHPPTIYLLQLPFYMLLMFIFCTIWSLFSSLLSSMSKDFGNLVKSMVTAVFWLSGIMWNVETISNVTLRKFLMLNPVTFLVNGFRNCFIDQVWFWQQPKRLLYFVIITFILLVMALWTYRKLRKDIPDVLG